MTRAYEWEVIGTAGSIL